MKLRSLMLCLMLGLAAACDQGPTSGAGEGLLRLYLTDAPGRYDAVNVTISEVSAHVDGEWHTVRPDPVTINLLEWTNGQVLVLGTADLPAGHYTQIRLMIDEASVVIDGVTHAMTIPSGDQTGLKLNAAFTIAHDALYELVLDFDAHRSVVVTGPPGSPGYLLQPTIRTVPLAITGLIRGTVSNPEHEPLAYAIAAGDTITSSMVEGETGEFRLPFLPPFQYKVSIVDTMGASFEQQDISISVGTTFDLDSVTLE